MYTIIRIDEPDFGCEGRPDGAVAVDLVWLRKENGEELVVSQEDKMLYERNLNEGDKVVFDEENKLIRTEDDQEDEYEDSNDLGSIF
jgi:hypothetical protein